MDRCWRVYNHSMMSEEDAALMIAELERSFERLGRVARERRAELAALRLLSQLDRPSGEDAERLRVLDEDAAGRHR